MEHRGPLGAGTVLGVPVPVWHFVITTDFGTFSLKPLLYLHSAVKTVALSPNWQYGGGTRQ